MWLKVGLKQSLFDIDCDSSSYGSIACVGIQSLHSLKSFYISSRAVTTRFVVLCLVLGAPLVIVQYIISPPGRHGSASGGLMFYQRFSFFNCRPSHSRTGARISTRIVALTRQRKIFMAKNLANFGQETLP